MKYSYQANISLNICWQHTILIAHFLPIVNGITNLLMPKTFAETFFKQISSCAGESIVVLLIRKTGPTIQRIRYGACLLLIMLLS